MEASSVAMIRAEPVQWIRRRALPCGSRAAGTRVPAAAATRAGLFCQGRIEPFAVEPARRRLWLT